MLIISTIKNNFFYYHNEITSNATGCMVGMLAAKFKLVHVNNPFAIAVGYSTYIAISSSIKQAIEYPKSEMNHPSWKTHRWTYAILTSGVSEIIGTMAGFAAYAATAPLSTKASVWVQVAVLAGSIGVSELSSKYLTDKIKIG